MTGCASRQHALPRMYRWRWQCMHALYQHSCGHLMRYSCMHTALSTARLAALHWHRMRMAGSHALPACRTHNASLPTRPAHPASPMPSSHMARCMMHRCRSGSAGRILTECWRFAQSCAPVVPPCMVWRCRDLQAGGNSEELQEKSKDLKGKILEAEEKEKVGGASGS